ncbi:hypothetical protein KY311_04205 [Candidatus Woesearchaeota archaeon]|nr:hypothetical protein [Candidatus Woesearchaeota archaeon]
MTNLNAHLEEYDDFNKPLTEVPVERSALDKPQPARRGNMRRLEALMAERGITDVREMQRLQSRCAAEKHEGGEKVRYTRQVRNTLRVYCECTKCGLLYERQPTDIELQHQEYRNISFSRNH